MRARAPHAAAAGAGGATDETKKYDQREGWSERGNG